ncbi:hypothetical protein B0T16DRAFT_516523 [Cercophora newfieldiana]|uniref:SET domain-containing protein n=1 Tax=Cercophora newfieldiana TaxID=92897 RepID=A0AA39XYN1_9PEZI|nr:hypothetical protein B0T16DRAFT_516523 [Cercophora newfieldiana]
MPPAAPPANTVDSDDSDDDCGPSPREAFHTNVKLCDEMLKTAKASVELKIRSSSISMGSGLYVNESIDACREIYHSTPLMTAVDAGNTSICHYCLESTTDAFGDTGTGTAGGSKQTATKACTGCNVARFCSKNKQLRVRSLKKIPAGKEITISYVDPGFDVAARREVLQREHFFECNCTCCRVEHKEQVALLKTRQRMAAFKQTQRSIVTLMRNAVFVASNLDTQPQFEDLTAIETRLKTYTKTAFAPAEWPDHFEPLPMARRCLATLYINQEKLVPALRLGLQGKLMSRCVGGPDWVNEMMDLMSILIVAGNIPPDSPLYQDKGFPTMHHTHAITYGYFYKVCEEAGKVFGYDSAYTKSIRETFSRLIERKPGARPGSREFAAEFEEGQKRVLAWAGVPEEFGLTLSA